MPIDSAAWHATGDGPFLICINLLPYNYTWQQLKDLVRPKATHGVWTQVQGSRGYAKVNRKGEAKNLYTFLVGGGRNYNVHAFDCSGREAVWVDCNCDRDHPIARNLLLEMDCIARDNTRWQQVTPPLSASTPQPPPIYPMMYNTQQTPPITPPYAVVAPAYGLGQQMQAMKLQSPTTGYSARVQSPQVVAERSRSSSTQHSYTQSRPAYSSGGIPINTSRGVVAIEHRGVFVQNLSRRDKPHEIERVFRNAGDLVDFKIFKDDDGKPRGHAEFMYSSAEDAQRVVARMDGCNRFQRRLVVRIDKNSALAGGSAATQLAAQRIQHSSTPVVVNGSR